MPALSIIIPIYNVQTYLRRCLDSIFEQQNDDIEVVMINDGSTDNSGSIAQEYYSKNSKCILINQNNKGLSAARNAGIAVSTGEYLWFVDSDDYLVSGSINILLGIIREHRPEIIATDVTVIMEKNNNKKLISRSISCSGFYNNFFFFKNGYVFPFSGVQYYIIKSSFFSQNEFRFKEGFFHEDLLFTPKLLANTSSIYYLKKSLYCYLIRDNSITTSTVSMKKCNDVMLICDELFSLYQLSTDENEKKIYKKAVLGIQSVFYKDYYKRVAKNDKKECQAMYLTRSYFFEVIFSTINPKHIIRHLQMKYL